MPAFHVPGIGFQLLRTKVLYDFQGAQIYIDSVSRAISDLQEKEQSALALKASEANWSTQEFSIHDAELGGKYGYHIPKVWTYSFFTYVHSLVETKLQMICTELCRITSLSSTHKKTSGSLLEKSANCLSKTSGLNIKHDQSWGKLQSLRYIRNIIVHRTGVIGADENEHTVILQYSNQYHRGITASYGWNHPHSYIRLSPECCKFFLDEAIEFFERILAAIRPLVISNFEKSERNLATSE